MRKEYQRWIQIIALGWSPESYRWSGMSPCMLVVHLSDARHGELLKRFVWAFVGPDSIWMVK